MRELLQKANKEKLEKALSDGKPWAVLYEMSFTEHVAFVLVAFGQKDWILAITNAEDPQEEVLKAIYSDEDIEWNDGEGGKFTPTDVIGLTTTMQRAVLSIMLFQRLLSALMAEAREGDGASAYPIASGRSGVGPVVDAGGSGQTDFGLSSPPGGDCAVCACDRMPGFGDYRLGVESGGLAAHDCLVESHEEWNAARRTVEC